MIVATLEIYDGDSPQVHFVDIEKLDLTDPIQAQMKVHYDEALADDMNSAEVDCDHFPGQYGWVYAGASKSMVRRPYLVELPCQVDAEVTFYST